MTIENSETKRYELHLTTSVKQGTLEDYAMRRPVLGTLTLKWPCLLHTFIPVGNLYHLITI